MATFNVCSTYNIFVLLLLLLLLQNSNHYYYDHIIIIITMTSCIWQDITKIDYGLEKTTFTSAGLESNIKRESTRIEHKQ